ncbi:acetolactate synthase small subunit [Algivirga pacifica]|uniref:Acetolactate synthase small subunit n=1 Tax=Algivirga pacifica TaxID=1162670 RepID=A0ABP9DJK2_9BACT
MEKKRFTLSIFTENTVGLTTRLTLIFTRRKINIESLTTSASEIDHVHRFTVVFYGDEVMAEKVRKQIEKQIDVIKCYCYQDDEIIYQEIALYKVSTVGLHSGNEVERIVRQHGARILAARPEHLIIEKTGHEHETHELYDQLKPFGLLQFARSGRIALTQERQDVSTILKEFDQKKAAELVS